MGTNGRACSVWKLGRDLRSGANSGSALKGTLTFFHAWKVSTHEIYGTFMFVIRIQGLTRAILFAGDPNHMAMLPPPPKWMSEENEIDRVHKIGKAARR